MRPTTRVMLVKPYNGHMERCETVRRALNTRVPSGKFPWRTRVLLLSKNASCKYTHSKHPLPAVAAVWGRACTALSRSSPPPRYTQALAAVASLLGIADKKGVEGSFAKYLKEESRGLRADQSVRIGQKKLSSSE